jgi:hypothetical protein
MKLKETRILDAEGARYACIANGYCTCCDCEEYDRILNDAAESSRKPGGITVDDLARIAEAIKPAAKRTTMCPPSPLPSPAAPSPTSPKPEPPPSTKHERKDSSMKTYTRHSIAGWDVYTDDETGRVHHLVDPDSNDPRTLYPYIPAAGGGWDNACGSLTLSALRGRMARNTIRFS